jgi:cyclopropane-fatty-acyl-phospholipid synthase
MAIIEYFLKRLIRKGHLRLIDAAGKVMDLGQPGTIPKATVRFHDPSMLFKLAQDFSLHFGEAYMDGRLTIEEGTLYDVLELFAMNYAEAPPMPWDCLARVTMPIERMMQFQNSLSSSRKNVAHHYDLSADFFKLFLDSDMQYSCAYFTHPENDIEQAQMDKKRLITSKLLLKEGLSVLDIGCGFGGLAIYMAKNFGVNVTGITLSTEQFNIATERVKNEGLEKQIEIRMCDYREEKGTYDRVVSVGMFEHVGVEHYPKFFASIKALLKTDGVALLHSIGRMDMPGTRDEWLHKYIFPGGYAPALSEVMPSLERSGLWATDIELLRMHYAHTLVCWRESFDRNREAIQKIYDERFCRMWEFFLIGSELEFRYGRMIVFQMQLAKNIKTVPITRNYMLQEQQKEKASVLATR